MADIRRFLEDIALGKVMLDVGGIKDSIQLISKRILGSNMQASKKEALALFQKSGEPVLREIEEHIQLAKRNINSGVDIEESQIAIVAGLTNKTDLLLWEAQLLAFEDHEKLHSVLEEHSNELLKATMDLENTIRESSCSSNIKNLDLNSLIGFARLFVAKTMLLRESKYWVMYRLMNKGRHYDLFGIDDINGITIKYSARRKILSLADGIENVLEGVDRDSRIWIEEDVLVGGAICPIDALDCWTIVSNWKFRKDIKATKKTGIGFNVSHAFLGNPANETVSWASLIACFASENLEDFRRFYLRAKQLFDHLEIQLKDFNSNGCRILVNDLGQWSENDFYNKFIGDAKRANTGCLVFLAIVVAIVVLVVVGFMYIAFTS